MSDVPYNAPPPWDFEQCLATFVLIFGGCNEEATTFGYATRDRDAMRPVYADIEFPSDYEKFASFMAATLLPSVTYEPMDFRDRRYHRYTWSRMFFTNLPK